VRDNISTEQMTSRPRPLLLKLRVWRFRGLLVHTLYAVMCREVNDARANLLT